MDDDIIDLADVHHQLTVDDTCVVGLSAARVIKDRLVENHPGATGIVGADVNHRGVDAALVRIAQEEKFGGHDSTVSVRQIWCTSSATGVTMPV